MMPSSGCRWRLRGPARAALVAGMVFLTAAGCGGGGGGSEDEAPSGLLQQDSCSVIGLKIVSGTPCVPELRSPVVPILITSPDGQHRNLCSGTLIGADSVLTAGHCFVDLKFPDGPSAAHATVVAVGGDDVPAERVTVHPLYREDLSLGAIFADVAVVHLARRATVAPLPVLRSVEPRAGETVDIFGYGIDQAGKPGVLRSGEMALENVTQTHLAAIYGKTGSGVCLGDSGGPATMSLDGRAGVIGVTSTGSLAAPCRQGDRALFINVEDPSVQSFVRDQVPDVELL